MMTLLQLVLSSPRLTEFTTSTMKAHSNHLMIVLGFRSVIVFLLDILTLMVVLTMDLVYF